MINKTEVKQTARGGEGTLQIGVQNNVGMSSQEACKLALNLFEDNFPKLQQKALEAVQERMATFCEELMEKIKGYGINDFSAFSDPDVQYILYEAQKGYAKAGNEDMLLMLTELVSKRIENDDRFGLKTVINQAISIAPSLSLKHYNYLALLFVTKNSKNNNITSLEQLKSYLQEFDQVFHLDSGTVFSFLSTMGCLEIKLAKPCDYLAKLYGFNKNEIEEICPESYRYLNGDYGLSYVGIILAITHIQSKTQYKYDPKIWIHD